MASRAAFIDGARGRARDGDFAAVPLAPDIESKVRDVSFRLARRKPCFRLDAIRNEDRAAESRLQRAAAAPRVAHEIDHQPDDMALCLQTRGDRSGQAGTRPYHPADDR